MALENFPVISYENTHIRDYYFRVKFVDNYVKDNVSNFHEHILEHGDTPESVSMDLYGTDKYWYLILVVNDIYDPFYEWILSDEELMNYAKEYVEENLPQLSSQVLKETIFKLVTETLKVCLANENRGKFATSASYIEIKNQIENAGCDIDTVKLSDSFIEELYRSNADWYWNYVFNSNLNILTSSIIKNDEFIKTVSDLCLRLTKMNFDTIKSILKNEKNYYIDKTYTMALEKNKMKIYVPNADFVAVLDRAWNDCVSRAIS